MTRFDLSPLGRPRALAPLRRDLADDDGVVERYALVVWSHLTEPGDGVAGRLVAAARRGRGAAAW